ncbi:MAG: hypothetical protein NTW21_31930 [Verrucomicrobia bacterium]|nr:hypothetical protein [Verrucomicrobiota bacterium]
MKQEEYDCSDGARKTKWMHTGIATQPKHAGKLSFTHRLQNRLAFRSILNLRTAFVSGPRGSRLLADFEIQTPTAAAPRWGQQVLSR